MDWISVKDKLPAMHEGVLIFLDCGCVGVGERFRPELKSVSHKWLWLANGSWLDEGDVTHWMPLPEPPAGEETT
jgi:hypothetical protein